MLSALLAIPLRAIKISSTLLLRRQVIVRSKDLHFLLPSKDHIVGEQLRDFLASLMPSFLGAQC